MNVPPSFPPCLDFRHEAMKTTYHIRICGKNEALARSLACECIHRIDELEQKLSRYWEGGDIHRINHMGSGETLWISEDCHRCLLLAMEACACTGGLFDPSLGTLIGHRKAGKKDPPPNPEGRIIVHPDAPAVTCQAPGRLLDLGGIGKGFTLDQIAKLLEDRKTDGALLSAASSTHLAIGRHSWPLDLCGDNAILRISLHREALSSSGTEIQGGHIVHPDRPPNPEDCRSSRVWARSPSAAFADAWSTALMLMTPREIESTPSPENMLNTVHLEHDEGFRTLP